MARRIETHMLAGPAGRLECLLEEPEEGEPREAVLVCHPHPQHGGTMHNKVVYRIARGLRRAGAVVLRFNFRGVNLSEGDYDAGVGELEDGRATLTWLRERYPNLPYSIAGFSFGSWIGMRLACEAGDPQRVIPVGYPAKYELPPDFDKCSIAKTFVHSTNDELSPKSALMSVYERWAEPKRLIWIEAEDHFFKGALDRLEQEIQQLPMSSKLS